MTIDVDRNRRWVDRDHRLCCGLLEIPLEKITTFSSFFSFLNCFSKIGSIKIQRHSFNCFFVGRKNVLEKRWTLIAFSQMKTTDEGVENLSFALGQSKGRIMVRGSRVVDGSGVWLIIEQENLGFGWLALGLNWLLDRETKTASIWWQH